MRVWLLEGSALLVFGSDTAGLVRIPACMTGTVGLQLTAPADVEERLFAIARGGRCSAPPTTGSGRRHCSCREITARAACIRDADCPEP
jgi:Asp-tRNA(Asn)/Glu-tRNA(Gln) amidotransferase A subunit family amidase